MLLLKRQNVPLDRDVIFLAESGEEGNSNFGIGYMVAQHFPEIDAEYCLAEGGGVDPRAAARRSTPTVETTEKIPRGIELVAHGISGHGSIPLKSNAIVHLAGAVGRVGEWRPDIKLQRDDRRPTSAASRRLAPPEQAKHYRDVLSPDPKVRARGRRLAVRERAACIRRCCGRRCRRTSSHGGYRSNVIPSEAKATLDVRMLPDEDRDAFLEQVEEDRRTIRPSTCTSRNTGGRPDVEVAQLDSELVQDGRGRRHAGLQRRHAADDEHGRHRHGAAAGEGDAVLRHRRRRSTSRTRSKGFGMHSDQERLLESELHRFVRFNWETVTALARAR